MTDYTLNDYQADADRTRAHDLMPDMELAVLSLGLAGESGEVADHIKKHLGHGHGLDSLYVKKELGDILWYVACLAETLQFSLARVAQDNIKKLRQRYPEGFSSERSINRDEGSFSGALSGLDDLQDQFINITNADLEPEDDDGFNGYNA